MTTADEDNKEESMLKSAKMKAIKTRWLCQCCAPVWQIKDTNKILEYDNACDYCDTLFNDKDIIYYCTAEDPHGKIGHYWCRKCILHLCCAGCVEKDRPYLNNYSMDMLLGPLSNGEIDAQFMLDYDKDIMADLACFFDVNNRTKLNGWLAQRALNVLGWIFKETQFKDVGIKNVNSFVSDVMDLTVNEYESIKDACFKLIGNLFINNESGNMLDAFIKSGILQRLISECKPTTDIDLLDAVMYAFGFVMVYIKHIDKTEAEQVLKCVILALSYDTMRCRLHGLGTFEFLLRRANINEIDVEGIRCQEILRKEMKPKVYLDDLLVNGAIKEWSKELFGVSVNLIKLIQRYYTQYFNEKCIERMKLNPMHKVIDLLIVNGQALIIAHYVFTESNKLYLKHNMISYGLLQNVITFLSKSEDWETIITYGFDLLIKIMSFEKRHALVPTYVPINVFSSNISRCMLGESNLGELLDGLPSKMYEMYSFYSNDELVLFRKDIEGLQKHFNVGDEYYSCLRDIVSFILFRNGCQRLLHDPNCITM